MSNDNVLEFPKLDTDFKHTSYVDYDGDLGVAMKPNKDLSITRLNDKDFEVAYHGGSFLINREALSEFLHVAITFTDPEDRYKPEGEFVACDY